MGRGPEGRDCTDGESQGISNSRRACTKERRGCLAGALSVRTTEALPAVMQSPQRKKDHDLAAGRRTDMRVATKIALLFVTALGFLFLGGGSMGQAADSANGIEGVWSGVLGGQLHLVVTVTKSSGGVLGGTMNSVDQHAVLALSNVTFHGDALRFEVPRVGGVYEGKLKKNARDISGSWTQAGGPAQALDFTRRVESGATSKGNAEQAVPKAEHTP